MEARHHHSPRLPQRRSLRPHHKILANRRPQRHRHLHRRRPQLAPSQPTPRRSPRHSPALERPLPTLRRRPQRPHRQTRTHRPKTLTPTPGGPSFAHLRWVWYRALSRSTALLQPRKLSPTLQTAPPRETPATSAFKSFPRPAHQPPPPNLKKNLLHFRLFFTKIAPAPRRTSAPPQPPGRNPRFPQKGRALPQSNHIFARKPFACTNLQTLNPSSIANKQLSPIPPGGEGGTICHAAKHKTIIEDHSGILFKPAAKFCTQKDLTHP